MNGREELDALRRLLELEEKAGGQTNAPQAEPGMTGSMGANLLDSFTSTFGAGDEITATEAAVLGRGPEGGFFDYSKPYGERYDTALKYERDQNKAFKEKHPIIATTTEILGDVLNPVNKLAPGLGGAKTLGGKVAAGAGQGAAYGAGYGFLTGEGEQDRLEGAAYGGALGAATGGALGYAGGKLTQKHKTAPTVDALIAKSRASFKAAEKSGAIIRRESFKAAANEIRDAAAREGIDKTLHPKALAALKRITDIDEHVTIEGAETLRRVLNGVRKSTDPDEARIGRLILDKFDDYMEGLGRRDLLAGTNEAVKILKTARGLWARAMKGETANKLIQRAHDGSSKYSSAGLENTLRQEFRRLLLNEGKMRQFSKAEQDAIRRVAKGGGRLSAANITRYLGKLAPTGIISSALSGGIGYSVGGPAGAAVTLGGGAVAREASRALTARNARLASEIMRQGGPVVSQGQLTQLQSRLAKALLSGGVPAGAGATQPVFMPRTSTAR